MKNRLIHSSSNQILRTSVSVVKSCAAVKLWTLGSKLPNNNSFTVLTEKSNHQNKDRYCQKDCVISKDSSKKIAVHQPAIKSWKPPKHINKAHHRNSQNRPDSFFFT